MPFCTKNKFSAKEGKKKADNAAFKITNPFPYPFPF
jgi:hypothetical protein